MARACSGAKASNTPEHLYLRDTQTGRNDPGQRGAGPRRHRTRAGGQTLPEPAEGEQEVHFQAASSDGSRVFFTDTARLSEESAQKPTGEESPADLYEFEVTSAPGEPLHGRLSDLTPDELRPPAARMCSNLIPGASEDGSTVYFVANGVLAPGATPGECPRNPEEEAEPPAGATCNLYVSEPEPEDPGQRETQLHRGALLLRTLRTGAPGVQASHGWHLRTQDLSAVTSRVSPERPVSGVHVRAEPHRL